MDAQQAMTVFRGPMVSVATPFTPDFELDLEALRHNIVLWSTEGSATDRACCW